MTLHAHTQDRSAPPPTFQADPDLPGVLADYLGDDEKGRGYIALMRRAADHGMYDRIVRWGTSPRPEATTVAVVRMLLPSTDRMQMANILGMSLESLEERLALVLPRGVRDYARTLSCRLPHWHRF